MPHPLRPLPAPIVDRVFSLAEARALGVQPERLRRRDVRRIGPGLYAPAGAMPSELAIAAALQHDRPDAVVSRLSAARIWAFPLPRSVLQKQDAPVDLTLPPGSRRLRRAGARARFARLPPTSITRVGQVRITTRAQTWRDLTGADADLSDLALTQIGDHLVRSPRPWAENGRTAPWAALEGLAHLVASTRGLPGAVRAARVLDQVRVGADSPRETELRLRLLAAGIPEPLLNVPVIGPHGRPMHEPDLQWPQWQVAAEYEGADHRTAAQVRRDIDRAERLRRIGWTEIRIMNDHMRDRAREAVDRVRHALTERGWRP